MNIAIIGGGIGGLAVAYNLAQMANVNQGTPPSITVYEASDRFGGNGDTVNFQLGTDFNVSPNAPYMRWADLGVNDFNATAYTRIVAVMQQIGYTDYAPLEDSTSYYTLDGSIAYTQGQTSMWTSPMTVMPPHLSAASDAFMAQAAIDATDPKYASFTVRQYIEQVFSSNPAYDADLGPKIIYPRINGMYFTDEIAPSELPLRAVMHYYAIQEGAGGKPAKRMYFVGGASNWINTLTAYMQNTLGIILVPNFCAAVENVNGAWNLYNAPPGTSPAGTPVTPDVVVIATHADDAAKIIRSGASAEVLSCLSRVKYLNGMSVAHTFAGMMPPDVNAWSTYNILIHQEAAYLKPYTISYVCNRHQNDFANPDYSYFGWPQFFITVNPPVPIPSQYVLTDSVTGKQAIANLRHNVFDFACLSAQNEIQVYQGANNLFFAGGWTIGAGLHEECWHQGELIANQIINGVKTGEHLYDHSRGAAHYAPAYIRKLLHSAK